MRTNTMINTMSPLISEDWMHRNYDTKYDGMAPGCIGHNIFKLYFFQNWFQLRATDTDSPTATEKSNQGFFLVHQHLNVAPQKGSLGLTKASHPFTHQHTHTHTQTIVLVWHPPGGDGHSIKPHPGHHENSGVLPRSTKNKLATLWHGNHELMG